MRLGLGLGLGIGRRRAAADPTAALVALLGADAAQFLTPTLAHLYQTDDTSTPVTAAAQAVGRWADRGTGPARTQAVAGSRPTYDGDGVSFDGGDSLTGTALSLTGAFTAYAVGTRANATAWIPLGESGASNLLTVYSDNNVYAIFGGGVVSAAYTGATGLICVRVRRLADNSMRVRATGMAEAPFSAVQNATFSPNAVGQRSGEFSIGTIRYLIVATADLVTDGRSVDVEAYLAAAPGGAAL